MIKKKIVIATGGTGGHVLPAYSLANSFLKKNYIIKITIDKRGMKYFENHSRFNFVKLPLSPLIKKNLFTISYSFLKILLSTIKSLLFLLQDRPSLVFGMGGYSSLPVCIAAFILRIKFIIYENNLLIGKANKNLLPFADKLFVSYKELEGVPKKYENKISTIGNIIREEIINLNINDDKTNYLENLKILVLGGSQAAKIFAEQLPEVFEKLKNSNKKIKIYQQCQKIQNDKLSNFYQKSEINYEIFNYTNNIIDYYSKANLVITRSGASVLGELINVKIPFIAIPLPSAADNHQYKNANFYASKGLGFLLEEKDIKNRLYEQIDSFYKDKSVIKNVLLSQRQYSDKKIFSNLNTEIEKILNEKN